MLSLFLGQGTAVRATAYPSQSPCVGSIRGDRIDSARPPSYPSATRIRFWESAVDESWPELPYEPWRETCDALHLFSQIVGKYRLAHTPWLNHAWHATIYLNARGFTTALVPDVAGDAEIEFDFIDHEVRGSTVRGASAAFALEPMTVRQFHARFVDMLEALDLTSRFNGRPSEIADGLPFAEDERPRPYDRDAVNRFFRACVSVDRIFKRFRTGFLGKASPVHFFWGSFDLAVTRFSGEEAPLHPGGIPALPDAITRESYSHQVSSAGFWPGAGLGFPAFYSYAYPAPEGFSKALVAPEQAYFDENLSEFVLPYDVVRLAADPEETLIAFLQSTYDAAADLGGWQRDRLDCEIAEPRIPRSL